MKRGANYAQSRSNLIEVLSTYLLGQKVTKAHVSRSEKEVDDFLSTLKPDHSDGEIFEYHVDRLSFFQDLGNALYADGAAHSKFQPKPTNDPETWPLLVIGQDEATLKSLTYKKRIWAQDDLVPLFPKSQGYGLMVSAFFSRPSGFHFEVSRDQLERINERRKGQKYSMQDVAKEERRQRIECANARKKGKKLPAPTTPVFKPALTRETLPWILYLNIGVNREGFFTWEKFYIQLEDLMDCLEVCYPDHQFCFELDWSGCHGKKAKDSPNVNNMNLRPSKNKAKGNFRDSVLIEGCLGKNPATQYFSEKIVNGHTQYIQHFKFRAGERPLIDAREENYEGVIKGMRQILMERDLWKDGMRLEAPVKNDVKQVDLSAKHVLGSCPDFANAKTLLQELIELRGKHFKVRKTPICHPELAGQGIEYAWGDSKRTYRRLPERLRSFALANKNQFQHVKLSLSKVNLAKSRRYAGKAFEYKSTYAAAAAGPLSHAEIESSVKKMKQHRDCGRLEAEFIRQVAASLSESLLTSTCTCSICV